MGDIEEDIGEHIKKELTNKKYMKKSVIQGLEPMKSKEWRA